MLDSEPPEGNLNPDQVKVVKTGILKIFPSYSLAVGSNYLSFNTLEAGSINYQVMVGFEDTEKHIFNQTITYRCHFPIIITI